jgi:hypothetical protein
VKIGALKHVPGVDERMMLLPFAEMKGGMSIISRWHHNRPSQREAGEGSRDRLLMLARANPVSLSC